MSTKTKETAEQIALRIAELLVPAIDNKGRKGTIATEWGRKTRVGIADLILSEMAPVLAKPKARKRNISCTCHLKEQVTGPVPHCCPVCDGDYSSFLAAHNCD